MSAVVTLQRTAFRTSRVLDFLSEKDLTAQCGHPSDKWHLVVVKELFDNALDACEEQGIAPQIAVTIDDEGITVADNGSGIPPALVEPLLDFSIKVSSREAYVAPDRGAQGNALKTVVAMPFVLDGQCGRVDVTGGGVRHEIAFSVDRIAQRPVADVSRARAAGSKIRVSWPSAAPSSGTARRVLFLPDRQLDQDAAGSIADRVAEVRRLIEGFAFLNPHLTLSVDAFGDKLRVDATNRAWEKWTPGAPTSPHWYEVEHLERLLGAYIADERRGGRPPRSVREFLAEFRGLSSTVKRKQVLLALDLAGEPLSCLLSDEGREFDHQRVAQLLNAMTAQTRPVPARQLGVIGRDHLAARFAALGVHADSFEYRRVMSDESGLPQLTEVAFGVLSDEAAKRRLVTGVNWSAAWINPFRDLGGDRSLDAILQERRMNPSEPIVLVVHVAHPRVVFTDRGKSAVQARSRDIIKAVEATGKGWTRQVKAEERDASARQHRRNLWAAPARVSLKDICYANMAAAWDTASDGGRLPTHWRQLFYVMRPRCDADPDADRPLRDKTFKQILEGYLAERSPGWDVLRGARGVFKEPHRADGDNGLAMSTLNVRNYLRAPQPDPRPGELPHRFPTHGARHRIAAALICEKEGFDELLGAEQIPERYDLALISTKGISAYAARDLAAGLDVPCFTLHDFDKNGFVMAAGFPFATDIGIRLTDVDEWDLQPEEQSHENPEQTAANLRANGATPEEATFIAAGRRVELNMFTGPQFVEFVEHTLQEHGVEKIVPGRDTLETAWERAVSVNRINALIRGDQPKADLDAPIPPAPRDLADRIHATLAENPAQPWDLALWEHIDG
jgi:hypothetical protein